MFCDSNDNFGVYDIMLFGVSSLVTIAYNYLKKASEKRILSDLREYDGSCHCKAVTFKFKAPRHLTIWDCNCSICFMKKNAHVVVPQSEFVLLSGEDDLTIYRFNTKTAKHCFCKHCGVQSFYVRTSVYIIAAALRFV